MCFSQVSRLGGKLSSSFGRGRGRVEDGPPSIERIKFRMCNRHSGDCPSFGLGNAPGAQNRDRVRNEDQPIAILAKGTSRCIANWHADQSLLPHRQLLVQKLEPKYRFRSWSLFPLSHAPHFHQCYFNPSPQLRVHLSPRFATDQNAPRIFESPSRSKPQQAQHLEM